jgi:hypothetical protein
MLAEYAHKCLKVGGNIDKMSTSAAVGCQKRIAVMVVVCLHSILL